MGNHLSMREHIKRVELTRQALTELQGTREIYIGRYPVTVRDFQSKTIQSSRKKANK